MRHKRDVDFVNVVVFEITGMVRIITCMYHKMYTNADGRVVSSGTYK